MTDLPTLAARLDAALPWSSVTTQASTATIWCADVVSSAAGDPLAGWRHALEQQQGSAELPHVAAAFVLQWWCESVATPIAYAAELASVVLAESGAGLGFELAPGLYPVRFVVDPASVSVEEVEREDERRGRGRAAYLGLVSDVARHFAPEVKAGSRQRWGLVEDVWRTAVARAQGRPAPRRVSCCFIYALPGMHACSVCPRLG
ncbi:MAG TPA: (2Fe-2S)-binding protein [Intrasporangium sp.]|nr:(2Fe-2S)-binding protein [Intrasporangium sp.]